MFRTSRWQAPLYRFLSECPTHCMRFGEAEGRSEPTEVARHDRLVALVERMLALQVKLAAAKTMLQRQIDATDGQIDRLVYELYGLTEEEVALVEGAGIVEGGQ